MSASLVGSEMCIRDRLQADPRVACRSLPRVAVAGRPTDLAGFAAVLRGACLLYTSDAADDM
eukprot:6714737-Alexandrium_andersonii.AAC.1